ncbi:MAG: DNA polymerase IV, partial [Bifidobacteriaceae bacterium]|nr:DNA polymerase IV [Bifidobacteriaceae bacterium]
REITPLVEQISVDEAFLDVSGAIRRLGSSVQIAQLIRQRVRDEQRLACSVGVARNKSVAKIASQLAKPDGLLEVPPGQTVEFLHALPVGRLWGVGGQTEKILDKWGIKTVGDLAITPPASLKRALGSANAEHLLNLAWGRDSRPVRPSRTEKSISAETTFEQDIYPGVELLRQLHQLAERVGWRLRQAGWACRVVGVKVRRADFKTFSRSRALPAADDVTAQIFSHARDLLDQVDLSGQPVRLLGVRVADLVPVEMAGHQATLEDPADRARRAEQAADQARARFGLAAVQSASAVAPPSGCPVEHLRGQPSLSSQTVRTVKRLPG